MGIKGCEFRTSRYVDLASYGDIDEEEGVDTRRKHFFVPAGLGRVLTSGLTLDPAKTRLRQHLAADENGDLFSGHEGEKTYVCYYARLCVEIVHGRHLATTSECEPCRIAHRASLTFT